MATTATLFETPYESWAQGNSVKNYVLAGASGAGGANTVRAAETDKQIYARGHISASGATTITLKSGAAGTVIATLIYLAAGTLEIPKCYTAASALLQLYSSADVTIGGTIKTLAVAQSQAVPPIWAM